MGSEAGRSAASATRLSVEGRGLSLKFIQITDSHVGETADTLLHFYAAGRALSAALAHIARHDRHGAAFIAHTGDMICTSSRPASYEGARSIYGLEGDGPAPGPLTARAHGLDLPWYYIPGNADDRDACRARIFPHGPRHGLFNYSWEVGGIRFLSLDWGAWKTDVYTLEPTAFAWLETQLQRSVPTIILTHHPPVHVGVEKFDRMTPEDLPRLQNLIRDSSVAAVFHGHTHYPWETRIGGVPVFGTGSITYRLSYDEGPPHLKLFPPQYRVVAVKDDGAVSTEVWEVEPPA